MSLTMCSYNYIASTKFYLGVAFSENIIYEGCSKSIGPLFGKNTIIYLTV